jgi:MoaA/NifB/PqqE/SkfB family radical SAM enzyme
MANLYYVQITRECKQNCRFCSNPPTGQILSLEKGKKLIDYYIKKGCDGLVFTGGEPTLSPYLLDFIKYAKNRKIPNRIVTNGQKLADPAYLKSLKEAGLNHLHLSIYSVREKIQDFLTRNPGSFKNILKAFNNLEKVPGITVDINTVINHYNSDHLLENVQFISENFPFINHFVWNNLDPSTARAQKNKDTIPKLGEFELSLHQAMTYLSKHKKTFRVERVPLCYLTNFEHISTETRKIVKKERRSTFFLDEKRFVNEKDWAHKWGYSKADCCNYCFLETICVGLFKKDKYYSSKELYPVFVSKEEIIKKILNNP